MGLALDNCCYCFPNREGGSSTEDANDEGRISIKISIDIPTKVSHLFSKTSLNGVFPMAVQSGAKRRFRLPMCNLLSMISLNGFSPMTRCMLPYPTREHVKIVRIEVAR